MATGNATIAALKVSLGLDSAQFETGLRDASATMQREARNQAKAAEQLERRLVALKSSLDPVYAAQKRVTGQMAEAQALYKAGAVSGGEYGRIMGQLSERLKAVSSANNLVASTQGKAVGSSKALQQAGLNLTRQFSDVGVSLAGGISPLTVLIQQGPQIADAFQMAKSQGLGFSGVMRGLVGAISPGTVAIGGFVAGAAVLVGTFLKGQTEGAKLANTLEITGINANLAGRGFDDLARSVQDATGGSIGEARKVLTDLSATGKFTGETMKYLAEDIVQLSRFTGQTGEQLTTVFSAMGDDVAGFASKFSQQYHLITAAQYEHIRLLQEQGRTTEAQLELSKALHEDLGKVAPENLGYVERAWRGVANAISGAIDNLKSYGRASSNADLQKQLASVNDQLGGDYAKRDKATRETLLKRQAELTAKIGAAEARTESARTQGEGVAAAERLAGKWGDMADNTARARREVQAYRADIERLRKANPGSGLIPSAAQQKQTEAAILKRNTPSSGSAKQGPRDQTEEQLAAAARAELEARAALTRNIQQLTGIKVAEIGEELKGQLARVETSKAIDAAQKPAVEQAYRNAAASKLEAAYRNEIAGLVGQQLDSERLANSFADRIANVQDALATNAEQQNAAASARLARQQDFERQEQAYQDGLLVLYGQIDAAEFERRRSALAAAQFGEALAQAEQNRVRLAKQTAETERSGLENQADILESQDRLVMSTFARNVLGLKILDLEQKIALSKAQEAVDSAKAGSIERQRAEAALATLRQVQGNDRIVAEQKAFSDAVEASTRAFQDLAGDIRSADVGGVLQDLANIVRELGGSSGLAQALGAGSSFAALGSATNALLGVGQHSKAGRIGGAAGGALAGLAIGGPVAAVVGALIGGLAGGKLAGKPTNAGAGISLVTGQITGDKRTEDTEKAARAAADAILGGEEALRAAGITLTETIHGLVIGSRDLSQIYTTSGRTITAAVGDVTAAAEAGLRAVLETATYASDAQRAVAEKALAAGKSFDEVIQVLGAFGDAQKISGALADEILKLTDPKKFDTEAVRRDIAEQRKAYATLSGEGYLTADQLASINQQLSTLEALRLDEVLKRYADAITTVDPANDNANLDLLGQVAATAADGLRSAYDAFAQAKQQEIDGLRQAASGLADFIRELNFGDSSGRGAKAQADVLRRELGRLSGLAPTDPERLANLQAVGKAFIEASRGTATDDLSFRRDIASVKRATEGSRSAAEAQADAVQAQLDVQTSMLKQLGLLTEVSQDMAAALKSYLAANANLASGGGQPAAVGFDVSKYLAANPDLARNFNAGGSLRQAGDTLEAAALAHYLTTGQYEIAAGTRKRGFATGGQFRVGGHGGIDNKLMQFWASPGEMISVTHGDPQAGVAQGMSGLAQRVDVLTAGVAALSGFARRAEKIMNKWDGDGLPAERVV